MSYIRQILLYRRFIESITSCLKCDGSSPKSPDRVGTATATTSTSTQSTSATQRINLNNPEETILPSDPFGETEVEEIVALGYSRRQAVLELRRFGGDKTKAIVALVAKTLKF